MLRTLLVFWLMVTLVGCKSYNGPPYEPNPPDSNTTFTNLRVVVTGFEGFRCSDTRTCGEWVFIDAPFFVKIPMLFFGWTETEYRNGAFERCLMEELSASNAFKEVKYIVWEDLRAEWKTYDVVITGTNYYDEHWQYTNPLFCLLGLLGLPCGVENREASMAIDVAFTDRPAMPFMQETIALSVPTKPKGILWFYEHPRIYSRCPSEDLQPLFLQFRKKMQEKVQAEFAKPPRIGKIQEAR